MKNTLLLLRIFAFFEGISFLLLLGIAMPMKYLYNDPSLVKSVGMAHGILFVLYVIFLLLVHFQYKWKLLITIKAFIASFVPFGTFYADKKWFRD
jgi:integral membrane protein